jgi:hypothetical protein
MKKVALPLVFLSLAGCSPKPKNIPVVYFGQWQRGEVKTCLQANGDDFLFCDLEIYRDRIENNQTERNVFDKKINSQAPPMTTQVLSRLDQEADDIEYTATHANTFSVTFTNSGIPQTDSENQRLMQEDAKQRFDARSITKWIASLQLAEAKYRNNAAKWDCRNTGDGIRCE